MSHTAEECRDEWCVEHQPKAQHLLIGALATIDGNCALRPNGKSLPVVRRPSLSEALERFGKHSG